MGLSEEGHKQAEALAAFFSRHPLDALYASPMERARQTLGPLLRSYSLTPVFLEGLREVDFGDWTGLSWEEVNGKMQKDPFAWLEYLDRAAIPNAECTKAWRTRVETCLSHILSQHSGQTVGVVCHGGVIRMLLSILLRIALVQTAAFAIEYASITRVDHRPNRVSIQLLNLVPWRDLQ
jgi:broad specificity phosphatase PhoE